MNFHNETMEDSAFENINTSIAAIVRQFMELSESDKQRVLKEIGKPMPVFKNDEEAIIAGLKPGDSYWAGASEDEKTLAFVV